MWYNIPKEVIKMNIYYIGSPSDLENLQFHGFDLNIKAITDNIKIIDSYHFSLKNEIITFDYLIIKDYKKLENIKKLDCLIDDNVIITNYYLQSSLEHIFALNQNDDVTSQLQKIVNFILNIDF